MMIGSPRVAALVAVTVLVLVFVAATAQDCSLDGYDLDTLKKQSYWEVDVDVGHCHHYYQGGTCTVYFSTCGTLPRELCGVDDAAVCQVAMSQDRNDRTSFVLGTAATRSLSPLSTGFTEHFSGGNSSNMCSTSMTAHIVYTCDPTAIWLSGVISATYHLVKFNITGCKNYLEVRYSGACYDTGPPQTCSYRQLGSYNITTLTSREMWFAQIRSPSMCYPSRGAILPCVMLLSFCRPLPRGACGNSTFCQVTPEISITVLSFGTYQPRITLQQNVDSEGFTISYTGGTVIQSCSGGISSTVVFECDPSARWDQLEEGNMTRYVRSVVPNTTQCMVTITLRYSGACPPSASQGAIIAGAVVAGIVLLVSVTVGIIIVAVTYKYMNRKYGGYMLVGVQATEEQRERLMFGQTSESDQSEDEQSSPPANDNNEDQSQTSHQQVTDDKQQKEEVREEMRMPTLETYQPN